MITKSYSKAGRSCRVTFRIPAEQADAQAAAVLGDWNGWNADLHPMERRKDGSWSATVTIEAGRPYRFRYLLDGERWKNDEAADALVPNHFGTEDSVLTLDEAVRTETVAEKSAAPEKAVRPAKAVQPAKTAKAPAKAEAPKDTKAPKASKAPRAGKRSGPKEH